MGGHSDVLTGGVVCYKNTQYEKQTVERVRDFQITPRSPAGG